MLGAVGADFLFYHHPVGWSAGAWLILITSLTVLRWPRTAFKRLGIAILNGLAGLAVAMVLQPGLISTLLGGMGIITLALAGRLGWFAGFGSWIAAYGGFAREMILRPIRDWQTWKRRAGKEWDLSRPLKRFAFLWMIPILLSMVFVGLFSMANPIIDIWVQRQMDLVRDFLRGFDLPGIDRMVWWMVWSAFIWTLLRCRPFRLKFDLGWTRAVSSMGLKPKISPGDSLLNATLVRCLAWFNLVFAVQTLLDATYLFSGRRLPEGLSHAEYAHRGAYPLVATALLAAGFVLAAFRPGERGDKIRLAHRLVFVWLGQNVFLTFTAAWRLHLYVAVYTLTRLRLAAGIWMLIVAMGLIWIIIRLATGRDNGWLLKVNALTLLAVLYLCSFINLEAYIANYNVNHCKEMRGEGPSIDVLYLAELGEEALPALHRVDELILDPHRRHQTNQALVRVEDILKNNLADWRGWSIRRARLRRYLVPHLDS